jgi:GDP-L-fucose synthase
MGFELTGRRVFVAGHRGMVGSAILRRLARERCETQTASRRELDLRRQREVEEWLAEMRPDAVFLAAATVGGIHANDARPADFIHDNLAIQTSVIEASRRVGVRKLVFLGSSCIYPKHASQPIREEELLAGPLEPTNQWYAVAKIAGVKMCQAYRRQHGCDFIAVMPTNLYGPGDNFDLVSSHVLPALMAKIQAAKAEGRREVAVWGTGTPRREFLHVDDLADACVFLARTYSDEAHVNVGCGEDVTIRELAELIARVAAWQGAFTYDSSKPDGTPRKLLDVSRLAALGWRASIGLEEGVRATYHWYLEHAAEARRLQLEPA